MNLDFDKVESISKHANKRSMVNMDLIRCIASRKDSAVAVSKEIVPAKSRVDN